jgi:hypothetical protein
VVLLTFCMLDKVIQIQFFLVIIALELAVITLSYVLGLPHTNMLTSHTECYNNLHISLQHFVTKDIVHKLFTFSQEVPFIKPYSVSEKCL